MQTDSRLPLIDIFFSSVFFLIMMFVFHQSYLDKWVASHFFSNISGWTYRDNFLLEKVLHKGGVIFIITIFLGLGIWYKLLHRKYEMRQLKNYLGFIILTSLSTILLVFILKNITTLPCPWNSLDFGGGTEQPSIWQMFSLDLPRAHCFPAGHSSGGYAFLSAYFGYTYFFGKRNFLILIPGVIIGVTFGLTQQARGAHYLSHDSATIVLSIFVSWVALSIYSNYDKK